MASPAAVLSILVEANTSAANARLAETNAQLDATKANALGATTATSKTGTALRKMGTAAKWGGAALAVGFVVEAKKAVTTTQDLTKTTLGLHKNLGLTNKAASEWAGVLKARGADSQKAGMAFKTFATQVSAAGHGSATAIAMFKELGFTQADLQKAMTNTEFGITKVADGLNKLPAGADKATFAGKLFGRGWQTIAPVLRDGSAAMQEQLDTVEKYGGVLQGKTLKQQEALLANIRENKIAWQGFQVQLASFVTPVLNDVSNQFQHISKIMANPKLTQDEKFTKVANIMEKDFSKALDVIVKMIPTIASRVGEQAPKIAMGLVSGFLKANVWGKLLIGSWLISKFGGWKMIGALGSKIGTRLGGNMATSTVESGGWRSAGGQIGGLLGPAVAAVAVPLLMIAYRKQITDWFHSHDFTLPTESIPGKSNINPDTSPGGMFKGFTGLFGGVGGGSPIPDEDKALKKLVASSIKQFGSLTTAAQHWSKATRDTFQATAMASHLPEHAFNTLQKIIEGSTDISGKDIRNLAKVTGLSAKQIQGASSDTAKKWDKDQKSVQKDAQSTNKKVSDSTGKMAKNVGGSYGNMVNAAGQGMSQLKDNTNNALKGLGMTKKQVSFAINTAHLQGTPGAHQKGGRIVGGIGSGDKVPAMLEPGEFVLNREAVKGVGQARLESLNNAIPRFQKGGGLDFALGPYTVPPVQYAADHAGANSHVHISAFSIPWLIEVGHKIQQMGNSVGEFQPTSAGNPFHFGPVTTSAHAHYPTDHYSGHAVDVNSLKGAEDKSWVASIANVLTGGAGAAVVEKIKRVLLKGPKGPLTDMGQAALDRVWHGANAFLAKQGPSMTMGKEFPVGAGALSRQEMRGLLKAHGMPDIMGWVALAESGFNPHAVNPSSGAFGLWQDLPSTWAGLGVSGDRWDPNVQATGNAKLYASQGLTPWAASQAGWGPHQGEAFRKGGMVPPFAGSFGQGGVVPGPMGAPRMIVAHGGETVGSGGDPIIHVHVHVDPGSGAGMLDDIIESHVEVALEENSAHLSNMGNFT